MHHQPESCIDGEKRTIGRPKKQRGDEQTTRATGQGRGRKRRASAPSAASSSSHPHHPQVAGKRPPDPERLKELEAGRFDERSGSDTQRSQRHYKRVKIEHGGVSGGEEEEEEEEELSSNGIEEEEDAEISSIRREEHTSISSGHSGVYGGSKGDQDLGGDIRSYMMRLEREISLLKGSMAEMEQGQRMLSMRLEQIRLRQELIASSMGYSFNANNTLNKTAPTTATTRTATPPGSTGPPTSTTQTTALTGSPPHGMGSPLRKAGTPPLTSSTGGAGGASLRLLDGWQPYGSYFAGGVAPPPGAMVYGGGVGPVGGGVVPMGGMMYGGGGGGQGGVPPPPPSGGQVGGAGGVVYGGGGGGVTGKQV